MTEWIVAQKIRIPFKYTAGPALSRFLSGLSEGKIWASCCGGCGRVYVPPLGFCGRCWRSVESWRELPGEGELLSYTVMPTAPLARSDSSPGVLGLIRLVGADTNLVHLIGGVDPSQLERVTRVRAVWREERTGSISDIAYFAAAS